MTGRGRDGLELTGDPAQPPDERDERDVPGPQIGPILDVKHPRIGFWLLVAVCMALVTAFAVGYVAQERYVYFWDYAIYWRFFGRLGSLLCSDPAEAVEVLFHSIGTANYNYLPVLPIAPLACILGDSRVTYIAALANVLLLPAALLAARLVVDLSSVKEVRARAAIFAAATLLFISLHPVWVPVLAGRPDVIGLAILFGALIIYLRRPLEEQSTAALILIGVLLATAFLARRWYAYWVVAFFPAALLAEFFRSPRSVFPARLVPKLRSLALIGFALASTVLVMAMPLVLRILETDYSDAYSAYKHSRDALGAMSRAIDYFGASLIIGSMLGLAALGVRRATRHVAVFLLVQGVILSALFLRVQDFGEHHYYLLLPLVFLGVSGLLFLPLGASTRTSIRLIPAVVALIFFVLSSLVVFSEPWRARTPGDAMALFPKRSYFPKVRDDFDQLEALLSAIAQEYRKSPGRIYVIGSSVPFNWNVLYGMCLDKRPKLLKCHDIVPTGGVDRRDGFPRKLLKSDYVVLGLPPQYHLRPEDQRLVGLLARDFSSGSGIARSFSPVGSPLRLGRDITVTLFKRHEPIPYDAANALSQEFMTFYPDHQSLFSVTPSDLE